MPRYALAKDNWGGRAPPALLGLCPGTQRLLPLVRVCIDVAVLGKNDIPRDQRQTGILGNHIMIPQSTPAQVIAALPPAADDPTVPEHFSVVLVGTAVADHSRQRLLAVPRQEYERAVRCLQETSLVYKGVALSQEGLDALHADSTPTPLLRECVTSVPEDSALASALVQDGPADAVAGEGPRFRHADSSASSDTDTASSQSDDNITEGRPARPYRSAASADGQHVSQTPGRSSKSASASSRRMQLPQASALIGGTELLDAGMQWLSVTEQLKQLCAPKRRRTGVRTNDCEEVGRLQRANELPGGSATSNQLLGRDKLLQTRVAKRVETLQSLAGQCGRQQYQRDLEKSTMQQQPYKLLVPTKGELVSMFDPRTLAMAMPDLFVYGDMVPFLVRETPMTFLEWAQMMLSREELAYDVGLPASEPFCPPQPFRWRQSSSFLPVVYDMNRRLGLIRSARLCQSMEHARGFEIKTYPSSHSCTGRRGRPAVSFALKGCCP